MAIGRTPLNQLNALPLQDADTNAAGGEISVVGGSFCRYFSPTVLQINGAVLSSVAVGINTYRFIVTPYLDLRGCSKFQFLLRRNVVTTTAALLGTPQLSFRTRMGASDAPGIVWINGNAINESMSGASYVNTVTPLAFPAAGAGGNNQQSLRTWAADEIQGFGGTAASIGSDSRLCVDWGLTDPVIGDSTFTAQLWASS